MSDPNETIRALRSTLVSKERELNTLLDRLSEVTGERDRALSENGPSGRQDGGVARTAGVIETDDRVVLQEVGIYTYQHPLENAEQYRDALTKIRDRIKTSVNSRSAIVASDMFSFNNSLAKGRKMTSDLSKLMLRAYNAEADICVRTIKAGNLATAVNRLEKASTTIAKLGSIMQMHVAEKYHALRVAELELTADYMMKVQEEGLAQREERERLREDARSSKNLPLSVKSSTKNARTIKTSLDPSATAMTTRRGGSERSWMNWSQRSNKTITAGRTSGPDMST